MHILLIHQAFAALDEAGGTRHYEMARFLVSRGHRLTIIASQVSYLTGKAKKDKTTWVDRHEPEPGITILRTFTYAAFHRSFFHRVLSFFSFMFSSSIVGFGVRQVDIVWGTSPPIFQGLTAWLLARLKRAQFLFEVRDLWPAFAMAIGVLRNRLLISASLWLEKFLYKRADRVVVNSPGFIQHVTERGARWVELVPNGADPSMFDTSLDGCIFRQSMGLDNQFVVLYAGAHGLSNDLGVIVQAANFLRDRKDIAIIMVGDGKEKPAMRVQADELGLTNLLFVPPIPKNKISPILAASDACIAILKPLELYKTTYPNKVFDYMAAGKAVILAIDGVIREVVESTGAGIAVPPGDALALANAITDLAADPHRAQQMGAAGRKAIEEIYNREKFAHQFALLLEDMR
jgi:glycosyltransferase involved in cell wall biosynthesis